MLLRFLREVSVACIMLDGLGLEAVFVERFVRERRQFLAAVLLRERPLVVRRHEQANG